MKLYPVKRPGGTERRSRPLLRDRLNDETFLRFYIALPLIAVSQQRYIIQRVCGTRLIMERCYETALTNEVNEVITSRHLTDFNGIRLLQKFCPFI